MLGRELSQRTYLHIGVTEPHHSISHHGNRPQAIEAHAKVNTYHLTLFAKFVERLRSTPDGDGSLLDQSLILYGSGMGNGNVHSADLLPTLLVGGAAGSVKGGRHIVGGTLTPERRSASSAWPRSSASSSSTSAATRAASRSNHQCD
jgi:hypothetical protein